MNVMKLLVFSDGTKYSVSGDDGYLWAIIASPETAEAALQDARSRTLQASAGAEALEAALATLDIIYRANEKSEDGSLPEYTRAYLSGTTVFVLIDAEQQVVEPDFEREDQSTSLFVRTGVSAADSLSVSVRSKIEELRQKMLSIEQQSIEELPWRVLRWLRSEEQATQFMSKIVAKATIGGTISIAKAQIVG